jgi:dienelactone hydrolase
MLDKDRRSGGPAVLVLLAVLLAGSVAAPVASAASAGTSTAKHRKARSYAVAARDYVFVDRGRSTPRNGTYPGAPTRTLPTLLLYPARGDPARAPVQNGKPAHRRHGFPLIVFSHGMGATVPPYRSALERWVRRGYVVAAPTFPLSSGTAPGGPSAVDYQEQPADVRFVVDRVLRLARRNRGGLRKTIDRHHIGAAGHSLGAVTTLAVATNSCCRDRRVDAAVAWAGLQLPFARGTYFSVPAAPLMLVHGTGDPTYFASVDIYRQASPPKAFVTLINGPHIPNIPPWIDPTENSTVDFFDGFLKRDRSAFRRLAADANVPGAASLQVELR